jgi:hypothetical protein
MEMKSKNKPTRQNLIESYALARLDRGVIEAIESHGVDYAWAIGRLKQEMSAIELFELLPDDWPPKPKESERPPREQPPQPFADQRQRRDRQQRRF